jgi:hypothetical protein
MPRRTVYVVGDAAENPPKRGCRVQGVLVHRSKQDAPSVMAPKDLGKFTKVAAGSVVHRQFMRLHTDFSGCRLALEVMFEGIDAQQALGGVESMHDDSCAPLIPYHRQTLFPNTIPRVFGCNDPSNTGSSHTQKKCQVRIVKGARLSGNTNIYRCWVIVPLSVLRAVFVALTPNLLSVYMKSQPRRDSVGITFSW